MQGGWQPPPGEEDTGAPPQGGGYGQPPPGGAPPVTEPLRRAWGSPLTRTVHRRVHPDDVGSFGNYEFNDMENSIIDKTASRAKLWGIISTVLGGLQCLASCGAVANAGMASYLPAGIIAIVIGVTFMGVGNSLKMVVQTQGNDLMHMMQALQKMGSAFMVQIICAIIGFVLAVLIFMLAAFVLVAAAASS